MRSAPLLSLWLAWAFGVWAGEANALDPRKPIPVVRTAAVGPLTVTVEGVAAGETRFDREGPFVRVTIKNSTKQRVVVSIPDSEEIFVKVSVLDGTHKEVSDRRPPLPHGHTAHRSWRQHVLDPGQTRTRDVDPRPYLKAGYLLEQAPYRVGVMPLFSFRFEGQSDNEEYENQKVVFGSRDRMFLGVEPLRLAK